MSRVKGILFSVPDREDKNKYFRMEINYKTKQTKIYKFESNVKGWFPEGVAQQYLTWRTGFKQTDIMTLEKCVNDVTPENVMDKMNMYILFS